MYYITTLDRFQNKYTSEHENLPDLRTNQRLNLYFSGLQQLPPLTPEQKAYQTFRIPKASGGFREINAPSSVLKSRQRLLINHLQEHCKILESPWAYAYIEGRSTVDAIKTHQRNNSKWFLKIDIKNFFPSCTSEALYNSLEKIFPICSWTPNEKAALQTTINDLCFLNNKLPQGAVSSPYLSNLLMLPYDYQIFKLLKNAPEHGLAPIKYVYTRYADDILISAKVPFNWRKVQQLIQEILNPYFTLKTEKTRFGNRSGRNWNLGLMLNKDNQITIGHKKKEEWKHTMMEIIVRHWQHDTITNEEKYQLMGQLAYYKQIEPEYFNYLNRHYYEKYRVNFEEIITPRV